MIFLALLFVFSIRSISSYLSQPLNKRTHSWGGGYLIHDFTAFSSNGGKLASDEGTVSDNEIALRVDTVSELSNVKAVRYFINLTNGIEAVAPLLKQGVPMEHINVRSSFESFIDQRSTSTSF